jgi:predicted MFS family arabinose efflux permease
VTPGAPAPGGLLDRGPFMAMFGSITTLTATALPVFLVGALGVQIREDLGFSKSSLGVALALFYLACALGSIHAGELADRIGPRRTVLLANAIGALCLLSVAVLARSFAALLASLLLGSLGLMLGGPATKVVVAREVPRHKHGLAYGIQMSAVPFAALLGGLAVPAIGLTFGWRWAFAGALVLPVVGMLTLPPSRPELDGAPTQRPGRFGNVEFRPLVMLGAATVLGAAAATTMASFFVVTGTEVGFSEGVAGLMLSAVSASVIALRVLFGGAADRFESAHPHTLAGLFVLSTVGFVLLATGTKALFPIGGFVALAFGWAWTGLMIHVVVRHHPHAPGLASGVIVAGLNLGSVLGPVQFGVLADGMSSEIAFGVTGGWTLVAAAAAFAGTIRLRRGVAAPERVSAGATS